MFHVDTVTQHTLTCRVCMYVNLQLQGKINYNNQCLHIWMKAYKFLYFLKSQLYTLSNITALSIATVN